MGLIGWADRLCSHMGKMKLFIPLGHTHFFDPGLHPRFQAPRL